LVPFAGVADSDDEGFVYLRTNPLQERGDYAILLGKEPIARAIARRLQEDWPKMQEKVLGFS